MQAGNGRGGRERRAGQAPGGGRGNLPQPRVNVPPTVPSNPTPQPPIPRRTRGVPRSLLYLSLLSIVLPLEGAVLGQTAAAQPVAVAQHDGFASAGQPVIIAFGWSHPLCWEPFAGCFHPLCWELFASRNRVPALGVKTHDISQHCLSQEQAQDSHRRAAAKKDGAEMQAATWIDLFRAAALKSREKRAAATEVGATTQTSKVGTVIPSTLPPTVVTKEPQPIVTKGRVQLALEDHRVSTLPSPGGVYQHEGGCKDATERA